MKVLKEVKFSVVKKITKKRTELLKIGGHRHFGEGDQLACLRAKVSRGDSVAEEIGFDVNIMRLRRRQLKSVSAKWTEEGAGVEGVVCRIRIKK